MRKRIATILILSASLFPTLVFGAVTYNRTPAGSIIASPVGFVISIDNFNDLCTDDYSYWGILASDDQVIFSDLISSTTLSHDFSLDLPPQAYYVGATCSNTIEGPADASPTLLEGDGGNLAFEVVLTFIPLTTNFIASSVDYIDLAVIGLGPLLYFIIGAPIAFWVLRKVISLVPKK